MSVLSCINEAMAVIKESVSQNERDEKRCWRELARKDSEELGKLEVKDESLT